MFLQWIYLNILQKMHLHLKIYCNVSQALLILSTKKIKKENVQSLRNTQFDIFRLPLSPL